MKKLLAMKPYVLVVTGIILGAMCWSAHSAAATITTTVDRDPVRLDESFNLVLKADGAVDADPDFRELERNFDILHRSQSTNMSFINGQVSNTREWTLVLMPKRLGELTIPAILFGEDRSPIVHVTVISAQHAQLGTRSEELFLEVDAEPRRTFVQAQILYTARLYRAVNIENASLTEPTLNDSDAVIKKLGEDRTFQTQRDGRRYQVVERRYAVFPQQSGALTINPIVFQGQIVSPRRSFFSPRSSQTKRVRSDPITLHVDPIPDSFQGVTWLPSRNLQLSEAWPQNPPQFVVGEPVTRTLSVMAEGLTSAQLPMINIVVPPMIKLYPDRPMQEDKETHQGITGIRQEKIALIPSQSGRMTLPAIEIPWWNTQTNTMEIVRLPERTVVVEAGVEIASAVGKKREVSRETPLAPIDSSRPEAVQFQTRVRGLGFWPWLTGFLSIGWLVTGMFFWRHHRRDRSVSTSGSRDVAKNKWFVERSLKQACERSDAQAAKAGLLAWGKLQWPNDTPKTIGEIGERSSEPFCEELARLNQALYSQSSEQWNGEALWSAFGHSTARGTAASKAIDDGLEPLWAT